MAQRNWFVVILSMCALMAPALTGAQDAEQSEEVAMAGEGEAAGEGPMEEIIVTAQKREQALMDVGIAITAITGDDIREMGMANTQEIVQMVPGLMLQQTRGAWIIRGVGSMTHAMGTEAATSVYMDDSYFYWAQGSNQQLFDMAQTEVLKGPQGTLFGRNATGGLIHFRTANPTRESEGRVDVTLGDYNQVRAEAAYGGPLSSKLSGRIAALYNKHDGYYTSHTEGVPDPEAADNWGIRGKLLWDVSDTTSVLLGIYHAEQDTSRNAARTHFVTRFGEDGLGYLSDDPTETDVFGWRNPEGYSVFNTWNDVPAQEIVDVTGGNLKIDWTGDKLAFTSITSYMYGEYGYREDGEGGPLPVLGLGGYQDELYIDDTTSITQEFNLSGGERFRWMVGAFYLNIDQNGGGPWDWRLFGYIDWSKSRSKIESLSGFGQIEYDLSESWRVVAGLRYTSEKRKTTGESWTEYYDGTIEYHDVAPRDRTMDSPWSGKLALEWFPTENSMAYASVNVGTKSGGFNSILLPEEVREYDDEELTAFEVGYKTELGAVTSLNIAAFFYDYGGYQLRTIDQNILEVYTINKDSESIGGEVELYTKPHQNLDLAFGLSLLDAKTFDIYQVANDSLYYFPERKMMVAPDFTINAAATWAIPMGRSAIELHGNFNYVDTMQYTATNDPSMQQDPYLYGFGSVKYRPPSQNWEALVWVKNMFNEEYKKGGDDLSGFGFASAPFNPPRWYGVTFRVFFGL